MKRHFRKWLATLLIPASSIWAQNDVRDSLINRVSSLEGEEKVILLQNLATQYINDSLKAAFHFNQMSYDIAVEENLIKEQIVSLIHFSRISFYGDSVEKAVEYSRQAIAVSIKSSYDSLKVIAYNELGYNAYYLGQFDTAITAHRQAVKIAEDMDHPMLAAASNDFLGRTYTVRGNYVSAVKAHLRALPYREREGNPRGIMMTYRNLALAYEAQENNDRALTYMLKALEITDTLGIPIHKVITYNHLGIIYNNAKAYKKSIYYLEISLDMTLDLGLSDAFLSKAYNTLGNAFNDTAIIAGSPEVASMYFQKALYHYKKALVLKENMNDRNGIALGNINLGMAYVGMKKFKKAHPYLTTGIDISKELGNDNLLRNGYKYLSNVYKGNGSYQQALTYHELYKKLEDSLFNREKSRQIEELRISYETDKKEQQIFLQEAKIAQQEAKLRFNALIVSGLIVLLLLLSFIGFLAKNRIQKKQALLLKDRELKYREDQLSAVIDSQEKERKRVAEDLHDGFGQFISVLQMNIDQLILGNRTEEVLKRTEALLKDMGIELKNICFNLMPKTLTQNGLSVALKELAFQINQTGKITIEVVALGIDGKLSDLQEVSLYRIIQEWLNNILKYANASHIRIQVIKDEQEITVTIEDNGTGFNPLILQRTKGNGWKNIQSRRQLIKGETIVDSHEGIKGTTFILSLPIKSTQTKQYKEKYAV